LTDWPEVEALPTDADLLHRMDLGRDVCSSVLTLREAHKRRTSQDVPGGATNVVEDQIDQYPLRVQIKRVRA